MDKQINLKGNKVTLSYVITENYEEETYIIIKIQGNSVRFDCTHWHNKELAYKMVHVRMLDEAIAKFPDAEYFNVSGKYIIALNDEQFNNLNKEITKIKNLYASKHPSEWNKMLNRKIKKIDSEIKQYEAILKKYENTTIYTKKELRDRAKFYNNINNEGATDDYNPYYYEIDLESYKSLPAEIEILKKDKINLEKLIISQLVNQKGIE